MTVVVAAVAALGCRGLKPAPPADDPEDQAMLGKLQAYEKCLADHSANVFAAADVFRRDPEAVAGVAKVEDPDDCIAVMATAKKREPHVPELEAAGDDYAAALQAVFAAATEPQVDRTKMAAAFDRFDAAQAALFDQVDLHNRAVLADELARRERKEGHTIAVIGDRLFFQADQLVRIAAIRWDQLDRLDLAAAEPLLAGFRRGLDELAVSRLGSHSGDDTKHLDTLADDAGAFYLAMQCEVARARDHVAFTDAERLAIATNGESDVVGTPGAVVFAYNRLVGIAPAAVPTDDAGNN
jgi:hypothetical protein